MNILTANELKVKGVSALDEAISVDDEVVITVRGKKKYVVMTVDMYHHLRECELDKAFREAKEDVANGDYFEGSIEEHIKRVTNG